VYPCGVRTLVEQLRDAYEKAHEQTRMTMDDLLKRSGLDIDRSSLRRKLLDVKDPIPMKTGECEALARALDVTLVVVPENEARAS
jgi:hypothetical protein